MLHASEPVGHLYAGKGTATPAELMAFIIDYPQLDLVLAHWGGGLPFYELMPEVAAACQRVRYDTAASAYLYDDRIFHHMMDLVGPDKILWGSDYPVLRQGRFLKRVLALDLDADQIFSTTAQATYRLSPPPPDGTPVKESLE
jgi:predicted TIM-barrel fold metal-dependent hydrolase